MQHSMRHRPLRSLIKNAVGVAEHSMHLQLPVSLSIGADPGEANGLDNIQDSSYKGPKSNKPQGKRRSLLLDIQTSISLETESIQSR